MVSDISSILFLLESEVIHFTPGVSFVSKLNLDLLFKVRQILHCMAINNEFLNSQGQASKVTFM